MMAVNSINVLEVVWDLKALKLLFIIEYIVLKITESKLTWTLFEIGFYIK